MDLRWECCVYLQLLNLLSQKTHFSEFLLKVTQQLFSSTKIGSCLWFCFYFLFMDFLFLFNSLIYFYFPLFCGFFGCPDENYYKISSETIKCKDGSKKFTKAQLNDDFCDCPDGTDEPGWFLESVLLVFIVLALFHFGLCVEYFSFFFLVGLLHLLIVLDCQ